MATMNLPAVHDAWVRDSGSGSGSDDVLAVGLVSGVVYRSLIKFTLPDWNGIGIRSISQALLRVKNSNQQIISRGANPRIVVKRNKSGWTSGSVDWASKPSTTTSGEATTGVLPTANGDWSSIDITDIVRAWAPSSIASGGAQSNYGVTLLSYDEAATGRSTEFWSMQSDHDPYIILVYSTNDAPNPPIELSPAVDPSGSAAIAYYLEGADRNDPGVSYSTTGRYVRFGCTRSDPDTGDYITGMRVQVFPDGATDATPGSPLLDVTRTYATKPVSVTNDLAVTSLTTGTAYRARMQTRDKENAWGGWSSLADLRFKPDTRPVLVNPAVDVNSARPTFYGSISDPDASASISAAWINVYQDGVLGTVALWSSGWVTVGGGTRFSVPYGGTQDLIFGTRYRYELALKDDVGGESAFVTGLALIPVQVTGPDAMSPTSVDVKRDTITPTLTIGHSSAFDAYELEVAQYSDGTGLLWDVPSTTMASATSKAVTYAGSVLAWGRTYWWRAKIRVGGTTWSEWSPWYPFYVNALPTKPVVTIDGAVDSGVGTYGAYVTVATTTPTIRLPFTDPDLLRGYADVPARREIEILKASDGSSIAGSPFVITSTITATYVPAALTNETVYRTRVRYDDSAGQRSEWSEWLVFKVSQAPSIAAGTAASTSDPTALLDWTWSSPAGKAQAAYEVWVWEDATGRLAWGSGKVPAADTQVQVPGYILADATAYRWDVTAYDTDQLSASLTAVQTWTTAFTAPAELTGVLTVTPDEGSASLELAWDPSAIATDLFWRYFIYRKNAASGLFDLIGEVADRDAPVYFDQEAPHGVLSEYAVTASNGWAESDPPLQGSGTLDLAWWIVVPGDTSLTFELQWVTGFRERVDPQQETFVPLGRKGPIVVSGDQLPPSGSITVQLSPANASLYTLIVRAATIDPYVLVKTVFGDVARIKIGAVDRDRGSAGIQVVSFEYRSVAT